MMKRILFTLALLISTLIVTWAQGNLISGIITDEDNQPLIGATILVKGTVSATVTDFQGRFSLMVMDSMATLVVSYTGFASHEYQLDGKKEAVRIKLQEGIALDEVVVSGLAISRRKERRIASKAPMSTPGFAPKSAAVMTYAAEPVMDRSDVAFRSETSSDGEWGSIAATSNINAAAGTLTAGEINDFSKWDLWEDVAAEDLMHWREFWKMYPAQRYPIQLSNQSGQAVVNAQVKLMDQRGVLVWEARTDNTGKAELWDHLFSAQKGPNRSLRMEVEYEGQKFPIEQLSAFQQGYNFLSIPVACATKPVVDIVFVVDATGSMQDEIDYLKAELQDVIQSVKDTLPRADLSLGSVVYRDQGEEYLTRNSPLSSAINQTTDFIKQQDAQGGGDNPEAVEVALQEAIEAMDWRSEASTRLLFLVLDAPPHQSPEILEKLERLTRLAAAKGIRIIPIACSGIDKSTEYLMRSLALATNGTYTFLTNDSGVGLSHIEPTTDSYDVEKLNDLLVRVIYQFSYTRDCKSAPPIAFNPIDTGLVIAQVELPEDQTTNAPPASLRFYPNPSSGPVNVEANGIGELFLADFSGKILERFTIKDQQSTIDIGRYPVGTYHLRFRTEKDEWLGDQLVLAR